MRLTLEGQTGQTLLDVLRSSGQALRAPCAGRGSCGKCRVEVHQTADADPPLSAPSEHEVRHLSAAELARGVRLACLTRFDRDGRVELTSRDDSIAVPQEPLTVDVDPAWRAEALASGRPLRAAVDVGTTTLAVALMDAAASRVLSVRTAANAQKTWGSDVVARIQAVIDTPAALVAQQTAVVGQVEALIREQLSAAGRSPDELGVVAVAGNTVMLHLFAGADPSGMARVPFTPVFLEGREAPAPSWGLGFPGTLVRLLPGISAFVGADLTAGVVASGLDRAEGVELLLDIGTNGEMVLGNRHGLRSTATAAGPAFEGAQITHGCPGVPGALDHAGWTAATPDKPSEFWYTTIADQPLVGICGSGLLDLAAALRRGGQLDETGYLELAEGDDFFPDSGSPVCLSQADVRQLQLAKGAIAAGIQVLCQKSGVALEAIARVHLAGGFGTFLRPASALAIGLLPPALTGKVVPSGNTALKGALLVLSRPDALERARHVAGTTVAVDLSAEPEFQMAFAEAMLFPEDVPDDE